MDTSIVNSFGDEHMELGLNAVTHIPKAETYKEGLESNNIFEQVYDIRTEEDILDYKKKTQNFLELCWGAWAGPEYDDIEDAVLNHRHSKPISR